MAAIVNVSDKRFQLGREDWVRPMTIGVNWNKIRIFTTWSMNGVNAVSNGFYLIGLCQGGIPYSSPACVDFIGVTANTYAVFNNIYVSTPVGSQYYNVGNSPSAFFWKRGDSLVTASTGISDNEGVWQTSSTKKTAVGIEFVKATATTVTIRHIYASAIAPTTDWSTTSRVLLDAENEFNPLNLTMGNIISMSVSGSNFLWDSVNLFWSKSSPTIEIGHVVVVRFY